MRQTNLPPSTTSWPRWSAIESLAQLRERIAEAMAGQKQAEARTKETRAAVEALVSVATVAYPEAALNNEISEAIDRQRNRLARMGFDFQRYLQMVNQTEDDLREKIRPEAVRSLTERLALGEYARREDVELSPAEAEAEFRALLLTSTAPTASGPRRRCATQPPRGPWPLSMRRAGSTRLPAF